MGASSYRCKKGSGWPHHVSSVRLLGCRRVSCAESPIRPPHSLTHLQLNAGIYWHNEEQQQVAQARLAAIPGSAVEAEPFKCYWPAEEYHQQVRLGMRAPCTLLLTSLVLWHACCARGERLLCCRPTDQRVLPAPPSPLACSTWRRAGAMGGPSARQRVAATPSAATAEGRQRHRQRQRHVATSPDRQCQTKAPALPLMSVALCVLFCKRLSWFVF